MIEIKINGAKYSVDPGLQKGSELYTLGNIGTNEFLYLEQDLELDIPIEKDDFLVITGKEKFSVGKGQPSIDLNPCLRKALPIIVNDVELSGDSALQRPKISGLELKNLDPQANNSQTLFIDIPGFPDEPLGDNQILILQPNQQFITTPCGNVGDCNSILELQLEEVRQFYPDTKLIPENSNDFALVIENFQLPNCWPEQKIDLLVMVNKGFPAVPLDMFYVSPSLKLPNGSLPKCAEVNQTFLEKTWQRFSWHYKTKPWNPNKDSLLSHIRFCQSRFLTQY